MVKKKVAVALSDWLLDDVDSYAAQFKMSRSAVVQEATALYLTRRRSEEERKLYQTRAHAAMEDMKRYAEERAREAGPDEPSSLDLLRSLRETGHLPEDE